MPVQVKSRENATSVTTQLASNQIGIKAASSTRPSIDPFSDMQKSAQTLLETARRSAEAQKRRGDEIDLQIDQIRSIISAMAIV